MIDYLTFGSNTLTFRAEQALQAAGVAVEVVPRPRGMVGRCTLALRLPDGTLSQAMQLLCGRRIQPLRIHSLKAQEG